MRLRTCAHTHISLQQLFYYPTALLWKTPWEGAQTTIYCAVSEEMEGVTGKYLADCKIVATLKHPQASDDEAADMLWRKSSELVKLAVES